MNRWIVIMGLLLALLPGLPAANETAEGTWLNGWLEPVEKGDGNAAYYLAPLEREGDLWAFELYYLGSGEDAERTLAHKGYVDGTDFKESNVVGHFIRYDQHGEVEVEGHRDTQGRYHGMATGYTYDGYSVSQYRHGEKHGMERKYHTNGQLKYEVLYLEGKAQDGERVFYDENGSISERHGYKGWTLHGDYLTYNDGVVATRAYYRDGDLEGWYRRYNEEGELTYRQRYSDGEKNGVEQYWRDGVLTSQRHYKDDKLHGVSEEWENGVLKSQGQYREGKRQGLYREWEDGVLREETDYIDRWQWVEQKIFYPDGTLKTHERRNEDHELVNEYNYDENGEVTYLLEYEDSESGRLKREEVYTEGKLTRRRLMVADRDWVLDEHYDPESGGVTDRYEAVDREKHGKNIHTDWRGYREIGDYRNGAPVGEHQLEDPEGNRIGGGRYRNGEKVGPWIYLEGETLVHEAYDARNRLHGPRKVVTLEGDVRLKAHYVRGQLHGEYVQLEGGRAVNKGRYHHGSKTGNWQETLGYDGLLYVGRYENGKETGEWKALDSDGYERARMPFHKGEPVGSHYFFARNGAVTEKRIFEDGELLETIRF